MQSQKEIKFYGSKQAFGFMSNFYPSPFMVDKQLYKTAEHYFQSKKFIGRPQQQKIIDSKTPGQAFKLARQFKLQRKQEWNEIKEDIMYEALRLKFNTHKDLKQKLLQTGNAELIEHTVKDKYWADGGNGTGKNRLGFLLMKLRKQLRNQIKK